MKLTPKLKPTQHAVLDYLTVLVFALAPTLLPLSGIATLLSYALAIVHLLVTICTDFPGGGLRWLPLSWHGMIELMVSPVLMVAPWLLGLDRTASVFFVAAGIAIFLVWWVTDYAKTASFCRTRL